jgi:hypothetical protein
MQVKLKIRLISEHPKLQLPESDNTLLNSNDNHHQKVLEI